jgi:EAL domain-containing protein (putative c-di-GMP-specific phosphodiesterase class I)/ActR/RegA family two-component response regulator
MSEPDVGSGMAFLAELSTIRVLVVDDQEHVRRWTRKVLGQLGIADVTECEDGESALARVTAPGETFDLILSDLRMPHQDGIEFIRALSLLRVQTAVILVSMEPERVIATSAMLAEEQGIHLLGVIAKPLTTEKLAPLLERLTAAPVPHRVAPMVEREALTTALPNGTLHLVYQPRIAMATGRLVGVEALVRWKHPDLGALMPDAFVDICEASESLGAWLLDFTLREALAFAARWSDGGTGLKVSVNVHAGAFADVELPNRIEALADSYGVPHERLTLELTERSVVEHAIRMLDVATRLRLKHFGLAVDDFGTGHSSLSQLQRLPFSELKIDRSFVNGSAESSTKRSVVEASVSLARNLKMTSVAEGIQQRPEWDLLQSLGCEEMQGYFTARPMSEEGLQAWVAQWSLNSFAPTLARR